MIERLLNDFLIQGIIDNRQVILAGLALLAWQVWEYWLGKTKKVEAGSTLELVLLTIKKLRKYFR